VTSCVLFPQTLEPSEIFNIVKKTYSPTPIFITVILVYSAGLFSLPIEMFTSFSYVEKFVNRLFLTKLEENNITLACEKQNEENTSFVRPSLK